MVGARGVSGPKGATVRELYAKSDRVYYKTVSRPRGYIMGVLHCLWVSFCMGLSRTRLEYLGVDLSGASLARL